MPSNNYNMLKQIEKFYNSNAEKFKKPLEKIINKMLNDARYSNGESIERHDFGSKPVKLSNLTDNLNMENFEDVLINSLKENEVNDKCIIELLWGDIQLGKRVQACIIMWISTHVLRRPVLYIFRNLEIDKIQLRNDINGIDIHDFNTVYIKKIFEEFNEMFEEDDYKNYKLPELKDIKHEENLNKLSCKDKTNPDDIFCCLMNYKQLEKINSKFNEYIIKHKELVNMTILTDESDLFAPTSSNDNNNSKDLQETTACEKLLAKMYTKAKYVLHITGTAHSLLYNTTTMLNENQCLKLKISKVHKMKRTQNWYGLFNNNINYNTSIYEWWNEINPETKKKYKYEINTDYTHNIKNIINEIYNRSDVIYNSLLISEEKIRNEQFSLIHNCIIPDFKDLFILIFHGKCLRLYLPKKYIDLLLSISKKEGRMYKSGGIKEKNNFCEHHKNIKLQNDYCYIDINDKDKTLNIKQIYKLLSIFINDYFQPGTVITITGKYGERGYSFTSDDYSKYRLHLTDQYFPCHIKTPNCTDVSQRTRLQGKYSDNPTLTLWTTKRMQNIMSEFYVPFMKRIENDIMDCDGYDEIVSLIEGIIDTTGTMDFNNIKYIDVAKKRKNIKKQKNYDPKHKGFRLIDTNVVSEDVISDYCNNHKLPPYECINTLEQMTDKEKSKVKKYICVTKYKTDYDNDVEKHRPKHYIRSEDEIITEGEIYYKNKMIKIIKSDTGDIFYDSFAGQMTDKFDTRKVVVIDKNNNFSYWFEFNKDKFAYKKNILYNKDKNKLFYRRGDTFIKSVLKPGYKDDENYEHSPYYWKSPDGWLFLHDPSKSNGDIMRLSITKDEDISLETKECIIDINVKLFTEECISHTDISNIRIGINEMNNHYKVWCEKKNIINCSRLLLKESLNNLNIKEALSKGVNQNGKSGKRGYNVKLV